MGRKLAGGQLAVGRKLVGGQLAVGRKLVGGQYQVLSRKNFPIPVREGRTLVPNLNSN